MKLTGFTDEASSNIDDQIKITKELGWSFLSARTIGELNIHDISDEAFAEVCVKLESADIQVAEFGTLIGNWSKRIDSDWSITENEIERCIPRMLKLGVKYARIMSYAQREWGADQMEEERFKRIRAIVLRFQEAGLVALHENCMNWGGFSADHTLRLLDEVPDLKLVFDTGNPISQRDRSKSQPFPWQDTFEFYEKVKQAIVHVHVKDAIMMDDEGEPTYTFAGEGDGYVKQILQDLKSNRYQGFVAIEPHMGKVFHNADHNADSAEAFRVYKEYGERFNKLVDEL